MPQHQLPVATLQAYCELKNYSLADCETAEEAADLFGRCIEWCADDMPGFRTAGKRVPMVSAVPWRG